MGLPLPPELPSHAALNRLIARYFKEDLDKLLALYDATPDGKHVAELLPFADRLGDPSCALLILGAIGESMPGHAATIQLMIRDLDQQVTSAGHTRSPLMGLLALYSHNPHGNHASALLAYVGGRQGGAKSALVHLRLAMHIMPDHKVLIKAIIGDLRSLVPSKAGRPV